MSHTYWQDAAADEAMQDDHALIWSAMLETIDIDLTGKRVLDAGCNRGGFLRMLAESDLGIQLGDAPSPIKERDNASDPRIGHRAGRLPEGRASTLI